MAYHGLDVYLNDHLAGGTAGVNLAQMAAEEHRSDEHGAFFGEIASEIRKDHDTLESIMAALNTDESATKVAAAEIGSKMMAPKFKGTEDQLNAFVTLETLSIGVEGKHCLWTALRTISDDLPELADYDIDELIERARDQRGRIEAKRLELAPQALAHTVNA
jgi:hypothetical protein